MSRNSRPALWLLAFTLASTRLWAGAPDWLRSVAKEPVPSYAADVSAVVLFDEQTTTVNDKGEIRSLYRRAYKILNTAGRKRDAVVAYFDSRTAVTHMAAWAIPPIGDVYESKDKDAIEMGITDVSLYSDSKRRILTIPYTEPGTVVGYEYEQIRRSDLLQEVWDFQDTIPVREARFMLNLPSGWETREHWTNWAPQKPVIIDANRQVWVLHDLPAVKDEPSMPAWRAVAGRMAIGILPTKPELKQQQRLNWNEFGQWYWHLASPQLQSDPLIQAKVKALTADHADTWSNMRAVAAYVQRNVRYVAIEIGVGGYQPHAASETFSNSYGDCKDKAVLLSAMLHQIGVESFLLLTHTDRGVVSPDFPTMYSFNHEVLAIALPTSLPNEKSLAIYQHPKLGRLLIFDPTSAMTPLGTLPAYLQSNHVLLVTSDDGEIIDFPNQPADINRLQRTASLTLNATGGISGQVKEIRTGFSANEKRAEFLALAGSDRQKAVERFLSSFLQGFALKEYSIENLENYDQELVLRYAFEAPLYAHQMDGLWLVRPRVLGAKSNMDFESEDRKYPLELDAASVQTDEFDIVLPPGYTVDELPTAVDAYNDYVRYVSKTEQRADTLHYERTYEIDRVVVPVDQVKSMRQFYRTVALDERSSAVLKKQ
jgi:hypothetical protein